MTVESQFYKSILHKFGQYSGCLLLIRALFCSLLCLFKHLHQKACDVTHEECTKLTSREILFVLVIMCVPIRQCIQTVDLLNAN
jgi:hypothetical protein